MRSRKGRSVGIIRGPDSIGSPYNRPCFNVAFPAVRGRRIEPQRSEYADMPMDYGRFRGPEAVGMRGKSSASYVVIL